MCRVGGDPPLVLSSIIGSMDLIHVVRIAVHLVVGRHAISPDTAMPAYPEPIKNGVTNKPLGYFPLQPIK